MSMNDFFENTSKQRQKVLFLDFHNLAHRLIFVSQLDFMKSITDPNQTVDKNDIYIIWKNKMMTAMFKYIKQFQSDKVIIAVDSKHNWRKDFYPEYKDGRQEKKDASAIDFKEFYPIMAQFLNELRSLFSNIYVFKVSNCEADDTIAVLSRDLFKEDDVVIVSTDRDFKQLMKYPHIRVYNPDSRTDAFMTSLDPVQELNIKIMCGDDGDNIGNVLIMEGYEGIGERRIGVGEKAASTILEKGLDSEYVVEKVYDKYNPYDKGTKTYTEKITKEKIIELVKKNFQRNLKLISFEHIPVEIKNQILEEFKSYNLGPLNTKQVFNYLQDNRLKIAEDFQIYSPLLKNLG